MSFENYLRSYENGLLQPYMNGEKSNSLHIIPDPVGSEDAIRKQVSDNLKDKRNSIYSVEASAERRIEIRRVVIE